MNMQNDCFSIATDKFPFLSPLFFCFQSLFCSSMLTFTNIEKKKKRRNKEIRRYVN